MIPRVRQLKALSYEVNIDDTSIVITALLLEEVDKDASYFGTFEEAKSRITKNLQTAKVIRNKSKIIKNLIEKFG